MQALNAPARATDKRTAPDHRIHQLAGRLHALGPRPLAEFIKEIVAGRDLIERLERYAALDPAIVRALGGDQLPQFGVIAGGRR